MNLRKINKHHTIDYIVVTALIVVFFISMIIFRFSHVTVKVITIFSAIGYTIWGVVHHDKAGHIDKKILLEYLGISFLSVVIVFSLLS